MTMTVIELIKALAEHPSDMPVYTEGCDCFGEAGSLEVIEDFNWDGNGSIDSLLISRSSEKARKQAERDRIRREKANDEKAAEQRSRGLIA